MKILPNRTWQNTYFKSTSGDGVFHITRQAHDKSWEIHWNMDKEISALEYFDEDIQKYFDQGTWQKVTKQDYENITK